MSALPTTTQAEQLPEKVKIKLGALQSQFLGSFCLHQISAPPKKDYVLEQCVAAQLYRRYIERFTMMKGGEFTFHAAEVIALKRLLLYTPTVDPVTDAYRNELLRILHQQIMYL